MNSEYYSTLICPQIIEIDGFFLLFVTFVTTWHHFATRMFYSTCQNWRENISLGWASPTKNIFLSEDFTSHLVSWQPPRATDRPLFLNWLVSWDHYCWFLRRKCRGNFCWSPPRSCVSFHQWPPGRSPWCWRWRGTCTGLRSCWSRAASSGPGGRRPGERVPPTPSGAGQRCSQRNCLRNLLQLLRRELVSPDWTSLMFWEWSRGSGVSWGCMRPWWGWWPLVSGAPGHYHLRSCLMSASHDVTAHVTFWLVTRALSSSLKMSHPDRTGHCTVQGVTQYTVHGTPGGRSPSLVHRSKWRSDQGPVFTMKEPGPNQSVEPNVDLFQLILPSIHSDSLLFNKIRS